MHVRMWDDVCAAQLVGERERKECVWLVYGWTSKDRVWARDTWHPVVVQHRQNPADPISAVETACESHFFLTSWCALFTPSAVVRHFWRTQWDGAWKYHHSVNKGSLWRWGEGVKWVGVWSRDAVIYYSWTLYLDLFATKCLRTGEASILDGWGSDIQTLLLAAYGKSPSLPGSLPRAGCHHPHPTLPPPRHPSSCMVGLSSNYIW